MKKRYLIVLIASLIIMPSLVFAYLDNDGGDNLENNESCPIKKVSYRTSHKMSDFVYTDPKVDDDCAKINWAGIAPKLDKDGNLESLKICSKATIASNSNNLLYRTIDNFIYSRQVGGILHLQEVDDLYTMGLVPGTEVYSSIPFSKNDLEAAFGKNLEKIDYLETGVTIEYGYNKNNVWETVPKGSWGHLRYEPDVHSNYFSILQSYTVYQKEFENEYDRVGINFGAEKQKMMDRFAIYYLDKPSVNLVASNLQVVGEPEQISVGDKIELAVQISQENKTRA